MTDLASRSANQLALIPGPTWNSFEQFRKGGSSALEEIPVNGVATLRGKAATFRVLRDEDFQRLLGIAADVRRLQSGLKIVMQAAKVVAKHPDHDHVQLLIESASMFAGSPVLPERDGHESFQLTPEEATDTTSGDLNLEATHVPRPVL